MTRHFSSGHGRTMAAAAWLLAVAAPAAFGQAVAINQATTHQLIRGFGGHNGPGWIADLAPAQVDTAFGTGSVHIAQSGLSVNRFTGQFSGTVT